MSSEYPLTPKQIADYQRDGYIKLNDVISAGELPVFRAAVNEAVKLDTAGKDPNRTKGSYEQIAEDILKAYGSIQINEYNELYYKHKFADRLFFAKINFERSKRKAFRPYSYEFSKF